MNIACLWFGLDPVPIDALAELCLPFSPQLAVRGHEALFIEIGKCAQLYSREQFIMKIKTQMSAVGLKPQLGFGTEITAAYLRACHQMEDLDRLPLQTLTDFVDPWGTDFLARTAVEKMLPTFRSLGVLRLGEFKKIPSADLVSRFGAMGFLCRQRVLFESPLPWRYWRPPEVIKQSSEFPCFEFYGELEPLLFELKKHLDLIFQRLQAREQVLQSLEVRVICESHSRQSDRERRFEFDFTFAQSEAKATLRILKERLFRDFQTRPILSPIAALHTTVLKTAPGGSLQKNLLHRHEEAGEQQQALLQQLVETHGRAHIFHAELCEDRRPEFSWRPVEKPTAAHLPLHENIPLRPTHLLKPEEIWIEDDFLVFRQKKWPILQWKSEAEKITGDWVNEPHNLRPSSEENSHSELRTESLQNNYDRLYLTIELTDGRRLFVFQTPEGRYFLQGFFG